MSWFRKRVRRPGKTFTALGKLKAGLEKQQRRLAEYLERKTQYWNRASKLIALLLFVLVFGGCCLLLILKAIIHF